MPPSVTVIVPCYNEEQTIHLLLEALYRQDYDHQNLEIIIADGLSTDSTRQVIQNFQFDHPGLLIRIIDNPKKIIPAALNQAIQAARGEIIVRLDAHSMPYPDYISTTVTTLLAGKGDNVGGIWEIQPFRCGDRPASRIARGIAAAAAHPLGAGDAHYRFTRTARAVDTVPFGAFRRDLTYKIGLYNESLLTNEDYEFNLRIRQHGGKIWLDPAIRSVYFARRTLSSLISQYWRYGYWKAQMLRLNPTSIRWRQGIPPLFVLSLGCSAVLAFWVNWAHLLLLFQVGSYSFVLFVAGLFQARQKQEITLLFTFPVAIACMHISWGTAFLWSLLRIGFLNLMGSRLR